MGGTVTYRQCPGCGDISISKALSAKDYTVSGDTFDIWECNGCTLRFTQHVPSAETIGPYYKSTAYVSHSDTNEGLINKLYHFVRKITLQSKRNLLQRYNKGQAGALLDVGAGTGAFSSTMKTAAWDVTGLEPDEDARSVAANKHGLTLQSPDRLYNLASNQFDAITLWHVLEHVHDLQGYMENFHRVLKQEGHLYIAVPNYTSHDADVYGEYWAAYDVPRHLYHFSPASMEKLAALKGFRVKAFKPMWFDSFYVSMLSEQYKTGRSHLLKVYLIGCISNIKTFFNKKKCSSVIYILQKK